MNLRRRIEEVEAGLTADSQRFPFTRLPGETHGQAKARTLKALGMPPFSDAALFDICRAQGIAV